MPTDSSPTEPTTTPAVSPAAPTAPLAPPAIPTKVLVLGGGPDGEREVSIKSATGIANGLRERPAFFDVHLEIIDALTPAQLKALPGDVIIPYLHGPYGEGGPLQDVLEADGRPYLGSGPRPARTAMDKVATKVIALQHGIDTQPFWILNHNDPVPPCKLPVIIKPVHEGSTLGLHVCMTHQDYRTAVKQIHAEQTNALGKHPARVYLIEPKIGGASQARELTVGLLDGEALPIIEIKPKGGLYDFEAKYIRDDTLYITDPEISEKVARKVRKASVKLAKAIGCRHIARADFMLDDEGEVWLLEINTTPGFTDHSLVPKAAKHAGMSMADLCAKLVAITLRDAKSPLDD